MYPEKTFDSEGVQKKGLYIVDPVIREFLNPYSPKVNEHFVKNQLYQIMNMAERTDEEMYSRIHR